MSKCEISKLVHEHTDPRGETYVHSHDDALEAHSHPIQDALRLLTKHLSQPKEKA